MSQVETRKNRITKNNKYDEYEKTTRHKQERYYCATYNFGHQTTKSILDHNIIKA